MADAINIPIKVIDNATSALSKIQKDVERLQNVLSDIGNAAPNISTAENAIADIDETAKRAANSGEDLADSVSVVGKAADKASDSTERLSKSIGDAGKASNLIEQIGRDFQAVQRRVSTVTKTTQRWKLLLGALGRTTSFKKIANAIQHANTVVNSQNGLIHKGNALIQVGVNLWKRAGTSIQTATQKQNNYTRSVQNSKSQVDGLLGKVRTLVATYVGLEGIKGLVNMSDTNASTVARLNMINDGSQTTAELQNKIYKAAQKSRGSYADMAKSVSKLQLLTGDVFKSNDEAIEFAGNLQKMFVISGASVTDTQTATLQLTQALSAGCLQGDEFKSIMEACPMIVHTLAEQMGVPVGEMKKLGSQGKITADVMRKALLGATDDINEKFESMPFTWGQIWTTIKNTFTKIMEPVLVKINEMFNKNREKLEKFATHMSTYIGQIVDGLLGIADAFISLLGNRGVHEIFTTLIYVFNKLTPILVAFLTKFGEFLNFLDRMGLLTPMLMTLAWTFIFYATVVKTAASALAIFNFFLNNTLTIVNGVSKTFGFLSKAITWIGAKISLIAGWLSSGVTAIAGTLGISVGWVVAIIAAIIAVIVAVIYYWDELKAAGSACLDWIAQAGTACWDAICGLWDGFTGWISGILSSAKTIWNSFWSFITQLGAAIWNAIYNALIAPWVSAWAMIGPYVIAVWNFISAVFRGGAAIIWAIMRGIWSVICNIWSSVYNFVANIVTSFCSYIVSRFNLLKVIVLAIFGAVKNTVVTIWNAIYNFVAPIVSSIYNYVSTRFNALKVIVTSIFGGIKTAIVEKVTEIYNDVVEWIENVIEYFTGLYDKMVQMGKDFIQGFIDGVTSKIEKATETVTQFCDNAVDAIENFFKIGSPSRLMRDLGGFVGEGFNLGLEDQINGAKTAAKHLSMDTLQSTTANVPTKSTGNVSGGSPTITINVHNTINSEGDVKKIVDQITIMLRDAMNNSAKGVYNYG